MQLINKIVIYYQSKKLKKDCLFWKLIKKMIWCQMIHFLQNVFQMTAIALMTHLNSSSEVVNHSDALFFRYGSKLLIEGHFEFHNEL